MKKYIVIGFVLSILGCSEGKLDMPAAKEKVQSYISDVDKGNYEKISDYYTKDFTESEPLDKRIAKFKELKGIMGNVNQRLLIDSLIDTLSLENPSISLTYRLTHDQFSTVEEFVVVKESGDYKISKHRIKSTEN